MERNVEQFKEEIKKKNVWPLENSTIQKDKFLMLKMDPKRD